MFNLEETACRFIKSYVAAGLPGAQGAVAGTGAAGLLAHLQILLAGKLIG